MQQWRRPRADFVSDLRHPTAWLTAWAMGAKTRAGMAINPDSAMTLAAYYACVRNISEDVAKLPLLTYRRLTPRGKERAPEHPAYALLHDAPNADMTAMTFREVLTHHAVAWGNGYAEIVFDGRGVIRALSPIHPSRVVLRRNEQGELVYDVYGSGAILHGATGQPYQAVRLRQEQMLHIKGLGVDGYEGYSVVRLAAESLGLTLAAQTFGAGFFGNGTHMSGVLEHPQKLSDTAMQHLRESWTEVYGGPENAGKPAILEEGMKWQRLGIPPEDAQFLETRLFQTREVCRWFRMPPHKVQDLADAHFTNIEQQNLEYIPDTLMPWCVRWEQELKRKVFADDAEHFAEHLLLGLLRGDQASRGAYYKARFEMGTLSPDDIRELENENELPEGLGKHFFIASNNFQPLELVVGQLGPSKDVTAPQPFVPQIPSRNGTNGHAVVVED